MGPRWKERNKLRAAMLHALPYLYRFTERHLRRCVHKDDRNIISGFASGVYFKPSNWLKIIKLSANSYLLALPILLNATKRELTPSPLPAPLNY